MRKTSFMIVIIALVVAVTASAQIRGRGRLQGIVSDKTTGKPVAGATVTLSLANETTQPIVTNTDAKGHWAALGLTTGAWNIDIVAGGYETARGKANVSEIQMVPMIKSELTPLPTQEPASEPIAAPASPLIPKEAVDAIKEGQDLLKVKPGDVVTGGDSAGSASAGSHTVTSDEARDDAKRAVADFEKALPLVPEDKPEAKEIRSQLRQVMAQAYYKAGDLPKAIAMLEQLNAVDPGAAPDPGLSARNLLLINLYLEHGDLDRAKAALEKLPAGAVTDPLVYTNIGILFLNKNNPADAAVYFTKAVDLDSKRADSYYYRGLAELQLKKNGQARSDFQQAVTLSPDSSEGRDAKQMLDALPKNQ
jgi:regulator of sirC expression with transglutaminase-like and TPR domain